MRDETLPYRDRRKSKDSETPLIKNSLIKNKEEKPQAPERLDELQQRRNVAFLERRKSARTMSIALVLFGI